MAQKIKKIVFCFFLSLCVCWCTCEYVCTNVPQSVSAHMCVCACLGRPQIDMETFFTHFLFYLCTGCSGSSNDPSTFTPTMLRLQMNAKPLCMVPYISIGVSWFNAKQAISQMSHLSNSKWGYHWISDFTSKVIKIYYKRLSEFYF